MKIAIGDMITVRKAGDIIPEVVACEHNEAIAAASVLAQVAPQRDKNVVRIDALVCKILRYRARYPVNVNGFQIGYSAFLSVFPLILPPPSQKCNSFASLSSDSTDGRSKI